VQPGRTGTETGLRVVERTVGAAMAKETEKLLTTRADAAKAALAATIAARDANLAREILERALCDLPVLTGAVEMLNSGLAALSERLTELREDDRGGDLAREVADLRTRVVELEKSVTASKEKKKNKVARP
jgi:hypothetical protein